MADRIPDDRGSTLQHQDHFPDFLRYNPMIWAWARM
jgi:hypothetical protein